MPPRFLSIKNFDKYQSFRRDNPPWFKLHRSLFGDREYIKLSTHHRFLYVGLIHLAVETQNKIYNDRTWIGQRLYIPSTEVDLTPLYRAGFILTSNLSRVLSETETETETEERERPRIAAPVPKRSVKRPISDDDKPTEKHYELGRKLKVEIGPEWGKFKNYCLAHGKQYVNFESAFRNWIANAPNFTRRTG